MNTVLDDTNRRAKNIDVVNELVLQYFVNREIAGNKGVPDVFQQWILSLLSDTRFLLHRGSSHLIIDLSYGNYISELTAQQKEKLLQAINALQAVIKIESNLKHYLFELKEKLNNAL